MACTLEVSLVIIAAYYGNNDTHLDFTNPHLHRQAMLLLPGDKYSKQWISEGLFL